MGGWKDQRLEDILTGSLWTVAVMSSDEKTAAFRLTEV